MGFHEYKKFPLKPLWQNPKRLINSYSVYFLSSRMQMNTGDFALWIPQETCMSHPKDNMTATTKKTLYGRYERFQDCLFKRSVMWEIIQLWGDLQSWWNREEALTNRLSTKAFLISSFMTSSCIDYIVLGLFSNHQHLFNSRYRILLIVYSTRSDWHIID